ncbi:hypothetical protein T4D_8877 [Trichinella pseudospiralis]|uniref:Uncharacterized protein n=1 Tax=Trichinella pseudospiralis TaxID=6337 RepID=A0A0V1FL07_TRIPS|nr:hypothetical protein T4D_8877 [Trichinella pseudospiralis]
MWQVHSAMQCNAVYISTCIPVVVVLADNIFNNRQNIIEKQVVSVCQSINGRLQWSSIRRRRHFVTIGTSRTDLDSLIAFLLALISVIQNY